jgi:UDP-N-acetylmuramyl pentapeptide phosphotransferase/UDP-N-acetylglucosamine-1-phosphate transferase
MPAAFPAAVGAGVACAVILFLLLRPGARFVPLDQPNARSLHQQPIPRAGGLALVPAILLGWFLAPGAAWLPALIAAALCLLSYVDDLRGLPVAARLGSHLAAAALVVPAAFPAAPLAWAAVLVVAVVWIVNLYNFMDGSDGLAAGMAVFGFCAYGFGAQAAGAEWISVAAFAVAAAAAAFLGFNLHPARMFLGDSGSIPLGFLAASLGLYGTASGAWPLWFPLLVFAPFIGDATLTLFKRLARRQRVWEAHRDHYYQRMVRMGLGHRRTAYVSYAAMAACAAAALWARDRSPGFQAGAFAAATALLVVIAACVDLKWARFQRGQGGAA